MKTEHITHNLVNKAIYLDAFGTFAHNTISVILQERPNYSKVIAKRHRIFLLWHQMGLTYYKFSFLQFDISLVLLICWTKLIIAGTILSRTLPKSICLQLHFWCPLFITLHRNEPYVPIELPSIYTYIYLFTLHDTCRQICTRNLGVAGNLAIMQSDINVGSLIIIFSR